MRFYVSCKIFLCGIIKIKYIYVIESEYCINIYVFVLLLWFFRIKEEVNWKVK